MRALRFLVLLSAVAAALTAARTHETNPMSTPAEFDEGKKLYRIHCGVCHGMEGKTGRGSRLARRTYRHGNSDAELFDLIEAGIPGTDMPGLWLEEDEIWKILLFARTFAEKAGEACEAGSGDPEAGRRVFEAQGSCLACHTVGSKGGRLGPDMSFAGESFTSEELREALLAPSREVARRYSTVRLVTGAGERVEGVWMNENLYSIHMMDRAENIRSFRKAGLQSLELADESLMPAYGDLLTAGAIDDLIAYLCTLRGDAKEDGK